MRSLAFFSCLAIGATFPQAHAAEDSVLSSLAQDPQWLSMLHYDKIGVVKQVGSQIEDPNFFLSSEGQISAKAELLATYKAFTSKLSVQNPNESAQCRFPGRLAWLQAKLPGRDWVERSCSDFEEWRLQLDAEKIFLVFPAAYLNSPSSMYGHTLFRVKKRGNETPLLDYAVNYAANTDPEDNQLVFSYKGLTGGYPGVLSVMPYYQKVKEYNFLENRDIWEYELSLTPSEVDQFVRHIWEMKGTSMPYYFFSQNCSYQLLTMLDAASPRLNLASQFSIWAIPADTVREMKRQGVLDEANYRPSTLNKIQNMLAQVSPKQIELAKNLVEPETLDLSQLNQLSVVQQAQTLDVAYEYSRYLSARKKSTLSHLSSRSIKLLSLRSKLAVPKVFEVVEPPLIRDDQGHETARVGVAAESRDGRSYGILDYRPSYHDVLDPKGGYLTGAELSMFGGSLRWSDSEQLQVNHFNFVNIHSMAPRNALMLPKSWHVNASLIRDITLEDNLVFRLKGGAGVTQQIGQNSLLAFFWNGSASADNDYHDGYQLETGPQIKWIWNGDVSNLSSSYQYLFDVNRHNAERQEVKVDYSHTIAKGWQWRAGGQYSKTRDDEWGVTQLSVFHYF
ncbi:DUF4105 domain-containing protein [Marinomonas gallaica]|uniref:Lnb N-terminal periplasmic domain-containing protein n=1 Tax=Marinomonas gallaica TaxID=1806667 RepID=UPI003CE5AB7D